MKTNSRSIMTFRLWTLLSLALVQTGRAADLPVTGNLTVTGSAVLGTSSTFGSFTLRPGGVLVGKGTYGSSPPLLTAEQGAGTRLLWHPRKAAFRAGYAGSTVWDEAAIGECSVAFGNTNIASGASSTASGSYNVASGSTSTAIGLYNVASGPASTSLGYLNTSGGDNAMALGAFSWALGPVTTTTGWGTYAIGASSTAMGDTTTAVGEFSTSMGESTLAMGNASTAMGTRTTAASYASTAIGSLNIGGGDPYEWIPEDPLFEIGNGHGYTAASNAVTVYKNGNMDVQGAITCAPGGDIPMFGE